MRFMLNTRWLVAVVAVATLSLTNVKPSQAGFVLQGGTETSTSNPTNQNFMIGYDFVSNTNQSLTALGFWDEGSNGLPRSFQVGLWATATQTLLATVTIDNTDPLDPSVTIANGQYRYETLGAAIALTSGTTYTLGYQVGSPNLSATDTLVLVHSSLTVDPNVSIPNLLRFQNTAAFTFPTTTSVVADNFFAGSVNAQLSPNAPNAVPAPAGLVLGIIGLGSCGIGGMVRRRLVGKSVVASPEC